MEHALPNVRHESFLSAYKPLLLVAAFIVGITALIEVKAGEIHPMRVMENFMAGFFIFFSFFKFLNLNGFAKAFAKYDVVAKRVYNYGYVYPFIELSLGIAFLLGVFPLAANGLTIVLMLLGIYGAWTVIREKKLIQCACLGTIFDLPMTKVTVFENSLMLAMALGSIALTLQS